MVKKTKVSISSGYDYKKGLKKLIIDLGIVVLSGLVVVWQDNTTYMVMIPIIKVGLNYLKHK